MVDRNNLNRIKGILSAKTGAEIPKYNPGGTFNINDADFNQWCTQLGIKPNPNTWNQYQHAKKSVPNGSLDQVIEFTKTNGANMAIPGDPNFTPTTAVENSAEVATEIEAQKQQIEAQQAVAQQVAPSNTAQTQPVSMNSGNNTATSNTVNDPKSVGLNIDPGVNEKEAKDAKKAIATQTVGQIGTAAFQGIGNAVGANQTATDSNLTKGIDAGYDTVSSGLQQAGGIASIVGTAMQMAGTAGDIIQELGGGTDQQTKMDKWMDSSFFSWNIGMLNGFAGKNSDSFGLDQDTIAKVGSSYGGSVDDLSDAASKAGKKYGLFSSKSRKKANAAIADAKVKQNLMGDIADAATDQRLAVQSMGEQAGLAYSIMTDGGYNQKYTYAAKHGGMLEWNPVETLEWEPQVELNWELPAFKKGGNVNIVEELEWIPEFKSGGKTEEFNIPEIEETTQKNVIPEGALHKNKHHMEHAEGLTKKGIPVIDDDGEQQAEIEHSEIIFTLEVTKKLEEYYEIFYSEESSNKEKEQAAIDAGKLLVYQILENTEDRTGLIDSCKQGGSLTLKKSTDDLIEEALEWMPSMIVVTEEIIEDSSIDKKKVKSDKELMKEAIKEVLIELLTK